MLCRYRLWQCLPRNDECAKPTPFYLEFCQTFKIMVAERKRVRRLEKDLTSTPEGVPLPSYRYGRRRGVHTKLSLRRNKSDAVFHYGLRQPTGNVGQHAKNNIQVSFSQAYKMTIVLK